MDEFFQSVTGYTLGVDEAFKQVKSAVCVMGRMNEQTIEALVERVRTLRESGVPAAEIRVVLPTEMACGRFRAVAEATLACDLADLEVVTPRGLALTVLSDARAQAAVGRSFPGGKARVTLPYEADFIFEDLKTLGIAPKRLREMLKFVYRGLSELADESADWLVTKQEATVVGFLREELSYLQCALEPELSNLATKAMRKDAAVRSSFARRHMVVGDYQDLSRASQLLCHLVAEDSIFIVANEACSVEACDSYPHKAGIEEFLQINPDAELVSLGESSRDVAAQERIWPDMDAEVIGIPGVVQECAEKGCALDDIAVVCFHPQWRRNVRAALRYVGIPVREDGGPFLGKGDVRYLDRSLSLRVVTVLRLLVDSQDSLAQRCLMGFGDYLAKSDVFVPGRNQDQSGRPRATLAGATEDGESPFGQFGKAAASFARFSALRGERLLKALCSELSGCEDAAIPRDLQPLLGLGETATASEMIGLIDRSYAFSPEPSGGKLPAGAGVAVIAAEELASCAFDAVVLVGFVNGLFPAHDYFDLTAKSHQQRERMLRQDREVIGLIKSAASQEIVVSAFASADLALADRFRLKIDRIRFDEGKRIACTAQSVHAQALLDGGSSDTASCS